MLVLCALTSFAGRNDSLLRLDLQNQNLFSLPATIDFNTLQALQVRQNQLRFLPAQIQLAYHLTEVDASANKALDMAAFGKQIQNLGIKNLLLNECNLLYLPIELSHLRHLQRLSLSNNYITGISEDYAANPKLSYLDLSNNRIKALPASFAEFHALEYLDLSQNPLLDNARSYALLAQLPVLHTLVIRSAGAIDPVIFSSPSLRQLDMSNSTCSKVDIEKGAECHLEKLTASNCNNLDLTSMSAVLGAASLKELEIGGSNFTGFEMTALSPNLTTLIMSGRELNHFKIKNSIAKLENVEVHFETLNCLNELLTVLAQSDAIKHVSLAGSGISTLPQSISRLRSLSSLDLSMNPLASISSLYELKQLQELNISGCELSAQQVKKLKEELPDTRIINKLAQKIDLPGQNTETFIVNAGKAQSIITKNGTNIKIPANSLVDENGKPVSGDVTINYSAYYSLGSIAASGINMNYHGAGDPTISPFESAGMFNISASANGQPVNLKKGKEIEMKFVSRDSTSYNYYEYDSIKETWTQTGRDSVLKIKVRKRDTLAEKQATKALQDRDSDLLRFLNNSSMPTFRSFMINVPVEMNWSLDNPYRGTFHIHTPVARPKEYLDTANHYNYQFEIYEISRITWKMDEEQLKQLSEAAQKKKQNSVFDMTYLNERRLKTYSAKTLGTRDFHLEITPDRERDQFLFKFVCQTDSFQFYATPILSGKNVDKTQKKVKQIYDRFQAQQKKREALTSIKLEKYRRAYAKYQKEAEETRRLLRKRDSTEIKKIGTNRTADQEQLARYMSLKRFGTYNCDRSLPPDLFVNIPDARYFDDNSREIKTSVASFIDTKSNVSVLVNEYKPLPVPANTVMTVLINKNNRTYLGRFSTLGMKDKASSANIFLSKMPETFTLADLDKYIDNAQ